MKEILYKINKLLSKRDKQFLLLLFIFSVFISFIETFAVSIIMPFIQISTDFARIHTIKYFDYLYNLFKFKSDVNFVIIFGIALIIFYLVRGAINLLYTYLLARFANNRYYIIAYKLFETYINLSYKHFIERDTSELTKAIINEARNFVTLISSLLFMISEFFVVIFIYSMLLYVNWKITVVLTLFLSLNALLLTKTISKKIKREGIKRAEYQKKFYEIINASFGNFKILKLRGNEKEVFEKFHKASIGFSKTNIINQTLSQFPRIFLESTGFVIVIFMVVYLIYKYKTNLTSALGLISMFILALYRLLPSFNRILSSYNQIMFYNKALDIVYEELSYHPERYGNKEIEFNKEIRLEDIYFEYRKGKPILRNINLTIKKGEKVGFIGESGGGKTTLIDLIIGLYKPTKGKIYIDDKLLTDETIRSWRKKIGYIPQNIYLINGTVAENVAFGSEFDEKKVEEVLKKANLLDFLEEHHEGISTLVGEGGIKLSGGQKQRVAIARALYHDPELLVLDEATSSLDTETESRIMDEIYRLAETKTLLIVAHRTSTIERCDKIYKVENGESTEIKKV